MKIGNLDISSFKVGSDDCKIYLGNTLLYPQSTPPTPVPSISYAVTEDISTYQDLAYIDVYGMSDDLWYKKNNLNEYEVYGVYGTSTGASETYYNGKLSIDGDYEYQYTGGSWVNVGEVSGGSTSYPINNSNINDYVGVELPTSFKIPVADVDALGGWLDFRIRTSDGGNLNISTDQYYYMGNDFEEGTVTNDGTYYNYSLPTTESITIQSLQYWDSETIHIVISSIVYPVYYVDKPQPNFFMIYNTVSDMEGETDIYVGKYGQVGNTIYKYDETSGWTVTADKIMTGTTVSNIRSSYLGINNRQQDKYYVNGSSSNGVYNWMYRNESPLTNCFFDSGNGINSDLGMVSFDWLTLDITQFTTPGYTFINGSFSYLNEITLPPYLTSFISGYINVYNNSCPIKVNILQTNDIALTNNAKNFFTVDNVDLYIYNGIKINNFQPANNYGKTGLRIHCPSSAVTNYRLDTYMKNCIPFIIPMDNGEADLSYGFYKYSYNTSVFVDLNATSINENNITNISYPYYLMFGSKMETIYAGAASGSTNTSSRKRVLGLNFEEGVKYIYTKAFYKENEGNLKDLPNQEIVENCAKKYIIRLPDSVETIGDNAFAREYRTILSGNEEIVIGSGITSIGNRAFYRYGGFIEKNKITCKAITPPSLGSEAFYDGTTTYIEGIYVPSESVEAYKSASGWSTYKDIIKAIPT